MSELGKLYYSLGLKTEDFEAKLNQIKDVVKGIGRDNNSISLNTDKVEEATRKVVDLKSKIDALRDGQNRVTLTCATPKNIVIDDVRISNTSALRDAVITALNGIEIQNVSISTANLKSQLKNEVWNIEVVADANNISKVAQRIRQFLTGNKNIKIAVSPDMSDKNIQQLRKRIETELGKSVLKGIKLDIERKRIQDQLNAMNLTATIDIKVNKTSAQQAVQDAVGNTNHINQGNNALNQRSEIQQRVNKKATDELGIRRSINDQMSRNTQLATILGNAMGNVFGAYMLKNFLENLVQIGGEIQKQRLALGHIIDNVANANALFEQMKQLAVKSPFGLLDLMQNARQLSAFGVEYNQLYDTMKRLSDMAAGLGIQFSRLALAYGETKERGFLDGKLVRQFSYMGLPVLQKVAEYYTQIDKLQNGSVVTAAQVRSMVSDKAVSFEDVDAVIKKMTEEGGQFYNMQEVMAESVAGKWKNLKDAIDIMYSDIVESNSRILKAPAAILTSLTKNYDALAVILAVVAARLIGHKGAMAINNALLNKNAQAVLLNKKAIEAQQLAEQKALATAIRKNGTLARLTAQEKQRLANLKQMSMAEMKQVIRQQELTKGDLQRLIMMDRLSKEQIAYLVRLKAISQAEVDAAMKMTRFGMVASSVWKSITSFLSGNWLFLLGTVIAELGMIWYRNSEKQKEFNEGIRQSADDFRKATAQMADEVNGLDFGSMSFGERETEIKSMVEYIKDNVPDAERKLADIFKTGTDGKFVKSSEEIFKALKNIVKGMEELSLTDLAEWENSTRDILDKLDLPDHVESYMKSRSELVSKFNKILGDMKASDRNAILDKFKSQYKNVLMEAFNLSNEDDLKKKSQEQLLGIISSNKDLLHKFLNSNQETFKSIISGTKNYWGIYLNEYDKTLESVATSMATLKNKIENKEGKLNWKLSSNQEKWKRAIDVTVTTEYKDKTSEEQKMIKQLMTNPEILTMLGVHKGTVDEFAKKVLNDSDIRKNVYLNIMTMYDGKVTQDPFEDWRKGLTGEVKTDKTAAGDYETIVKQTKSAVEALNNAKKASNLMRDVQKNGLKWESKVSGSNAVTADWKEKIETFAQQLTTLESNLETAHQSALSYGFDWNKILADAQKKTDKGSGSSSKKDTYLESVKEQFDELKKAYSEYQKWLKVVGEGDAMKEVKKIINFDQFKSYGINEADIFDNESYQKAIDKFYKKIISSLNTTDRKKFGTSIKVELSNIEFNGVQQASQELAKNIQEEINNAMKQWDVYKSWFSATGDKTLSLNVALNIKPIATEESEYFYDILKKRLEGIYEDRKAEDAKSAEEFKKVLNKGGLLNMKFSEGTAEMWYTKSGVSELLPLWKKVKELMVSAGYEYSKGIAQSMESLQTSAEKMSVINEKYKKLIDADKTNNNGANVSKLEGARDLEKLKIGNTYITYMQRNLTLTQDAAKDFADIIKGKLLSIFKKGGISADKYAEEIKKINDEMRKIQKSQRGSGTFGSKTFEEAFQSMYDKGYQQFTQGADLEKSTLNMNDALTKFTGQSSEATGEMLQNAQGMQEAGQGMMGAASQASGAIGIVDMIIKGINQTVQALNKSVQYIDEMLASLGNDTGADTAWGQAKSYVSGFAESSQHAADSWENAKSGNFAGMVAEQIGSVTSIVTNFNKLHDAKLQAQIDKMTLQNTTLGNIYSQLQTILERTMGGIYNLKLDDDTRKQLQNIVNNTREYDNTKNAKYSSETQKAAQKALDSGSYYDAQFANLLAQRDNLQAMYDAENDKKDTDYSGLEDLRSQLSEINDEISYFAEDMMKSLYGIDFKDWASQLGDALIEAWAKGENAADAYAQTVQDLMKSVTKSVISQSIIETALEPTLKAFKESFVSSSGQLDLSQITWLGQQLGALYPQLNEAITQYLEQMQTMGLDLSETTSSSASSSIQNISEETASILAALMQGMRLDLSIQRLAVESIRDAIGIDGRPLNVIAEAQLSQLGAIAENTNRNAQAAEFINETLNAIVAGTKTIHVE